MTQQEMDRELGFVRGLVVAQQLANARGYYDLAIELGELAISPDTFILANTGGGFSSAPCKAQSHAQLEPVAR
jgi:hypothetical protein